jgi:hypothetical protein
MSVIRTNMRDTLEDTMASRIPYEPSIGVTAMNVQDAIEAVQANVVAGGFIPPAIVPTAVTFAMSPYTVLTTDYLLEVDTTGGAVVIQTQPSVSRARLPFTVKAINANPNGISVLRDGAETIDGMTSYPIDAPYDAKTFSPKSTNDGYEVSS